MGEDIVIDTNVLVYLENEGYQYHTHCCKCVNTISQSDLCICFDEGFDLDESKNESYVWYEYSKHLPVGSAGYTFVLQLLNNNRISFVSKKIHPNTISKINQSGIKKSDRKIIKVVVNSNSKRLISDEHEDFNMKKRGYFKDKLGVLIIHSWEYP